ETRRSSLGAHASCLHHKDTKKTKDAPRSCPCESSWLRVFVVRFFWLRLSRATFSKVRQRRPEQLELLFQDGQQLTCFSQVSFAPDPLHLERRVERSIGVQRSQPAFECVRGFAEPFSVPSCCRVAHLRQIARTALEEQIYKPAQEFLVPVNGCQERLWASSVFRPRPTAFSLDFPS